jgi:CheY-like chemotaxis protein
LIVKELLARRSGVQLDIAVDGASGVAQALQLQPELILIDMQLPDMDGLQVLQRLRAHATLSRVPCIALSANAVPEDVQRALDAGMADYWTKPLDFNAFLAALDRLFGTTPVRPPHG